MDPIKRPSDKSYSESMNEWAAQRDFIGGNRSRILHPPYDAHPLAKLVGYLIRLLIVLAVPALIYLGVVMAYTGSKGFNEMVAEGVETLLNAKTLTVTKAEWSMDGIMTCSTLNAKGGPDAFFESMEAKGVATRLPFPALFRREWIWQRVSLEELKLALRSGGLGTPSASPSASPDPDAIPGFSTPAPSPKTGATSAPPQQVMQAGYGIAPDFKLLKINGLQVARLSATWGTSATTSGSVAEIPLDMTRTTAGWVITAAGGFFELGWLGRMPVDKVAATMRDRRFVMEEAILKRPGGGSGKLTGSLTLGDVPEVEAELKWASARLEDLVPAEIAVFLSGEADFALKITGSPNRISGIKTDGGLELKSGRLSGLPVLKMLHQLTGEDQYRLLPLRSGKVTFKTGGSPEHGGLVVEVTGFEADCGPMARLKGSFRQERIKTPGDLTGAKPVERVVVSGSLQIGVPDNICAKLKPAVATRFFTSDGQGWMWLTCPADAPVDAGFTSQIANQMLKLQNESP